MLGFCSSLVVVKASAQRVGFFNIGLGRVLDKILCSGSRSGEIYDQVFPGIFFTFSGYFGYFQPRGVPQSYLALKWQILHPGVLFVVPKEEHLMMVLFSSYG